MGRNTDAKGRRNISGPQVAKYRMALPGRVSQRILADRLQLVGVDLGKNTIQQIECGKRFVADFELAALAKVLGVTLDDLLRQEE